MSTILLLTNSSAPSVPSTPSSLSSEIIPALGLLPHQVSTGPSEAAGLLDHGPCDAVLVDARSELPRARSLCRTLRTTGLSAPLIAIVTEGGLIGVNADWGVDDVLLPDAGPAEVDARLRLAIGRRAATRAQVDPSVIRRGELVIEEETYTARLGERALDLTFKEFELLRFMAQHPGRVFTRQQLLQDVWGYDYFGGTRTVDVHVRRLRAKLGPEHEALIGTVRNVGYRFVKVERPDTPPGDPEREPPGDPEREPPGNPVAGWLPAGSVRV